MLIVSWKRLLFVALFSGMLFAQSGEEQFAEDVPAPRVQAPVERFAPRILPMRPTVPLFEEGSGFEVDMQQAQAAIEKAYSYIESHFKQDSGDVHTNQNNQLILQVMLQERAGSVAQVFARRNAQGSYLLINIFPSRGMPNQSQLNQGLWRPATASSPAFWRIRYDLASGEFWGLSYDLRF